MPRTGWLLAAAAGAFALSLPPVEPRAQNFTPFQLDQSQTAEANASLELVLEPDADGDGTFRGVLLIGLSPGWKTYWLDPGEGGIPPSLDVSASVNIAEMQARYPAPTRFTDDYGYYNGYTEPLAVALTFRKMDRTAPAEVELSAMLGVCKDICIPFRADLSARPAFGSDPRSLHAVERGFALLPDRPQDAAPSARLGTRKDSLLVTFAHPPSEGTSGIDLFVKGPDGWYFGPPERLEQQGDTLTITVPVVERPGGSLAPPAVHAVLTTPQGSIEANAIPVKAPRS